MKSTNYIHLSEKFFDTFIWRIFLNWHIKHAANHLINGSHDQHHVLPANIPVTITIIQPESPCIITHTQTPAKLSKAPTLQLNICSFSGPLTPQRSIKMFNSVVV